MDPLSEKVIRNSFVNCTKGEASRLRLPLGFGELTWEDLDFLGWVDPGALLRSHIVMPGPDGPRAITLRVSSAARKGVVKSSMCQICLTPHSSSGVNLFVAPLAGPSGRQGNTVGIYMCADLACSLYMRGKRQPKLRFSQYEESLTLDERIARAMDNLNKFADKVAGIA